MRPRFLVSIFLAFAEQVVLFFPSPSSLSRSDSSLVLAPIRARLRLGVRDLGRLLVFRRLPSLYHSIARFRVLWSVTLALFLFTLFLSNSHVDYSSALQYDSNIDVSSGHRRGNLKEQSCGHSTTSCNPDTK